MWYVLPLVIAAVVSATLAAVVWRRRAAPGAISFILLMLAVAQWSAGYAWELASTDQRTMILLAKLQYLGIVLVPVLWLAFSLQYTGRQQRLTRRTVALLAIEPLVILSLVWTNETHLLIWRTTELVTSGSFAFLQNTYGVAFWIHAAYSYLLVLISTIVLVRTLLRSQQVYRRQAIALLLGAFAPWIGNALYLSGLNPFPHLDLTPFAFTLTGMAISWDLFRYRLLDIVPVARDAVIENMSDGVIVLDAQNRVVDINPAAQRIINRTASDVIGEPAAHVFAEHPKLVDDFRNVNEAHTEISLGVGNNEHCFELRISPLHTRHGQLGRLIVLSDITERKQAEQARLLLIQEQVARAQAEEEIVVRDEFLSIAAHELKTPLTTLFGHTQALQRRAAREQILNERDQRALRVINEQAGRLNRHIGTLLDLSRIELGQFTLDCQPLDVRALVGRVVEELESTLDHHTIQLHCADESLIVWGDELRLEQVLQNLLQNAIKYSPQGGSITLCVERHDTHGRITIRDQGIGIPQSALPHLFQRFYRAGNVDSWNISGVGIGLYLVNQIVTRHGGQIEVTSTEGTGSTFAICLPLLTEPAPVES